MSKAKRTAVFFLVALGLLALGWCSPWHGFLYRGDGEFVDQGEWAHPRYILRLPRISLSRPGEYTFNLRGLPSEEFTLRLFVVSPNPFGAQDLGSIKSHRPFIEVVLTDSKGKDVRRAAGHPYEWNGDGAWDLVGAPNWTSYWHRQFNDVPVQLFKAYALRIRIADASEHEEELVVVPTLTGGGMELP